MQPREPYYGPPWWWLAAYVAATAAVMYLYYSTADAAPAPSKKPLSVKPGTYQNMAWGGVRCGPVSFNRDGTYRLAYQGECWVGKWSCQDGVLYVEEWPEGQDSRSRLEWSVVLSSSTSGRGTYLTSWGWKVVCSKSR